jgi:hypothetical protein
MSYFLLLLERSEQVATHYGECTYQEGKRCMLVLTKPEVDSSLGVCG